MNETRANNRLLKFGDAGTSLFGMQEPDPLKHTSVREYVFCFFFQISKKHDFLRFFGNDVSKSRKSL